jgi:hypothetical protein
VQLCSKLTAYNNFVLHVSKARRKDLECSHQKKNKCLRI